jgi:hypothetical protein
MQRTYQFGYTSFTNKMCFFRDYLGCDLHDNTICAGINQSKLA